MGYKILHLLIFTCTLLCFVHFTELSFNGSFIYNLSQNLKGRVQADPLLSRSTGQTVILKSKVNGYLRNRSEFGPFVSYYL